MLYVRKYTMSQMLAFQRTKKLKKRIEELEKENRRLNKENKKLNKKADLILALIEAGGD